MKPYAPKASNPKYQADLNAYYLRLGVTEEIVEEDKGFILKIYVNGKHIGGEQQLPDALKNLREAQPL
mgnify:CR=1 FL=1